MDRQSRQVHLQIYQLQTIRKKYRLFQPCSENWRRSHIIIWSLNWNFKIRFYPERIIKNSESLWSAILATIVHYVMFPFDFNLHQFHLRAITIIHRSTIPKKVTRSRKLNAIETIHGATTEVCKLNLRPRFLSKAISKLKLKLSLLCPRLFSSIDLVLFIYDSSNRLNFFFNFT